MVVGRVLFVVTFFPSGIGKKFLGLQLRSKKYRPAMFSEVVRGHLLVVFQMVFSVSRHSILNETASGPKNHGFSSGRQSFVLVPE